MNREHHRWYSPSLGRDMDLLVFGHAGARLLVFPTSKGKFYEWEDRGMMQAMGESIENGWLQVFCVDSVDEESWYAALEVAGRPRLAADAVRQLPAQRGLSADAEEPEPVLHGHRRQLRRLSRGQLSRFVTPNWWAGCWR